MCIKNYKKKYSFLRLNRARIFTEFEYARLSRLRAQTCSVAGGSADALYFASPMLGHKSATYPLDFFFTPSLRSPALTIFASPGKKKLKFGGQSRSYQNFLQSSFTTSQRAKFTSAANRGKFAVFKKAKWLAFFEHGSLLFEQKTLISRRASWATFLVFEFWYDYSALVNVRYAKVAGLFVLYPYWTIVAAFFWTWYRWLGWQEARLVSSHPTRIAGNFSIRWSRARGIKYSLSSLTRLKETPIEILNAVLSFYIFVLLFLLMLDGRQLNFIKLLDTLQNRARSTLHAVKKNNFDLLIPKSSKFRSRPTFVFLQKSWLNLQSYVVKSINGGVLMATRACFDRNLFAQNRLSLDIDEFLRKFKLNSLQSSKKRVSVFRRGYENFFAFNNSFRPGFLRLWLLQHYYNFFRSYFCTKIFIPVFFTIKPVFVEFFFSFLKKGRIFLEYFKINCLCRACLFKFRVVFLFMSLLLCLRVPLGRIEVKHAAPFVQLSFLVLLCYLVLDQFYWCILLLAIWFSYTNFFKFAGLTNGDFFSYFQESAIFKSQLFSRVNGYNSLFLMAIFRVLCVVFAFQRLILLFVKLVLLDCSGILLKLNFYVTFWWIKFFHISPKGWFFKNFRVSVSIAALTSRHVFRITRVGGLIIRCCGLCSDVSSREFMWLLIGFVQIFWAQLAWWRSSSQDIITWRQIFSVNGILSSAGFAWRSSGLGGRLVYVTALDHLTTFIAMRHFLFWSPNVNVPARKNITAYFSFLSNAKVNLLHLNWGANFNFLKTRSLVLSQPDYRLSLQFGGWTTLILQGITKSCDLFSRLLGRLAYAVLRLLIFILLLVQISGIFGFLFIILADVLTILSIYFIAKFFLLAIFLSNFRH